MEFVILIGVWLACGHLGNVVASEKCAGPLGAFYGFVFGPLGLFAAAFIDRRPSCPMCGTRLNKKPTLCVGCKGRFEWKGNECHFLPPK